MVATNNSRSGDHTGCIITNKSIIVVKNIISVKGMLLKYHMHTCDHVAVFVRLIAVVYDLNNHIHCTYTHILTYIHTYTL